MDLGLWGARFKNHFNAYPTLKSISSFLSALNSFLLSMTYIDTLEERHAIRSSQLITISQGDELALLLIVSCCVCAFVCKLLRACNVMCGALRLPLGSSTFTKDGCSFTPHWVLADQKYAGCVLWDVLLLIFNFIKTAGTRVKLLQAYATAAEAWYDSARWY